MHDDPRPVRHHRDPMALLRFAVREGDLRLAQLLAGALRRERRMSVAGAVPALALPASPPVPPRSTATPSPLARRTLDALLTLLGIDDPARGRRRGDE